MKRAGRHEPYTAAGIARLQCVCGCGRRASHQWGGACADNCLWRPLCDICDAGLNLLTIAATNDPQASRKARAYCQQGGVPYRDVVLAAQAMARRVFALGAT